MLVEMCAQSEPDNCKDPKEQAIIRIRREFSLSPPQYKSGQSMEELTVQECMGGVIGMIFAQKLMESRS
jgi:hypothetical protein